MQKNFLITGGSGQLGSEIKEISSAFPDIRFYFTTRADLDITNSKSVDDFIFQRDIDTVINCAAYTEVDKAESEEEEAELINHLAVGALAEIAKERKVRLVHISTDYVFSGIGYKPYLPEDPTSPVNAYGQSKLNGEKELQNIYPDNSLIIRTSWVYSSYGNNFVKTMLRLGREKQELNVISDQVGVPTYAKDLARFILYNAVKAEHQGVKTYHYTNEGVCSWYDFATEIMELSGLDCKVKPIPTSAYPTPAKRPFYSLMDKSSLKNDFGIEIPYWKASLKECLQILNK